MCISISSTIRDYYFFDDENMPAGPAGQHEKKMMMNFFHFFYLRNFGDSGSADNEMLFCFTVCMY